MLGETHPDIGETYYLLCELNRLQGLLVDATRLGDTAVTILENTYGPRHPLTVYARGHFGIVHYENAMTGADKKIGEMMISSSLEFLLEKQYGEKHPWILRLKSVQLSDKNQSQETSGNEENEKLNAEASKNTIAQNKELDAATFLLDRAERLKENGHYLEAKPLFEQCAAIRKKLLKIHIDTTVALLLHGDNLRILGQNDVAEGVYNDCIDMRVRLFGPQSNNVAIAIYALAENLFAQGLYEEAEKQYRESLSIREQTLEKDDPDIGVSKLGLALTLKTRGKFNEAKELIDSSYTILKTAYGMGRLESVACMVAKADILFAMGKYMEAKPLYEQGLAFRRKLAGDSHPLTAESIFKLGECQRYMAQYEEADKKYDQSLHMRKKYLGESHSVIADCLSAKGELLRVKGLLDESLSFQERALNIRRKVLLECHSSVADSYFCIAEVKRDLGAYEDAKQLLMQCLDLRKSTFGEEHYLVAQAMFSLAETLRFQGKLDESKPLYSESNTVRRKVLGKEHPDYLQGLQGLADYYANIGNWTEARSNYSRVLKARKRVLGNSHPDIAATLNSMAEAYRIKGKFEQGLQLCLEARAMREEYFGTNHHLYFESQNNYALMILHAKLNSGQNLVLNTTTAAVSTKDNQDRRGSKALKNQRSSRASVVDEDDNDVDGPRLSAIEREKTSGDEEEGKRESLHRIADDAIKQSLVSTEPVIVNSQPTKDIELMDMQEEQKPVRNSVAEVISKVESAPSHTHGSDLQCYDDAEKIFLNILQQLQKYFAGREHPVVYNISGNLGIVKKLAAQAKAHAKVSHIKRELEKLGLSCDDEELDSELGMRMPGQDEIDVAIEYFEKQGFHALHPWLVKFSIHRIAKDSLADYLSRYKRIILSGRNLLSLGKYYEAESKFIEAKELQMVHLRKIRQSHCDKSEVYLLLGYTYLYQGKLLLSEKAFEKCLNMRRKCEGDIHLLLGEVMLGLGELLRAIGRYDEAKGKHE